ncbi:MAG: hypothetical protein WBA68_02540 [Alteraurantiacibacter sp.]
MAALTAPRNTPAALGDVRALPLPAGGKVFQGAMVALTAAGFAAGATATAGQVTVGRADETADNTDGQDGDNSVKTRRGVFRFANSAAADAIDLSDVGKDCFVVDDQTVAKTDNAGARPVAGKVFDVDAQGVWVEFL